MSSVCELTGKSVMFGHKVSHSQRKTNKKFSPNLHRLSLMSLTLSNSFCLRISTNALRTINKKGGLDKLLLDTKNSDLSCKAQKIKKRLLNKISQNNSLTNIESA
jgi:large subunit ribosomal protein L28